MSTSFNFKDNLTVDNNKFIKWLDNTGTSRANIVALDNNNNVNIISSLGDMYINSNNYTFFNRNNTSSNVLVCSKLGIGFNSTYNMNSCLTLAKNSLITLNTENNLDDGYIGLCSGTNQNTNSRIILYGIDHNTYTGDLHLFAGNANNGNVKVYTGNDTLRMQILQNGTFSLLPNGTTTRLTVNDTSSTITNDLIVTSTTESHNASTGALQILGGIGIRGNLYIDGTISLNTATGNINFDSTQTSDSYTTGAIFISGGIGISTTVNSNSVTSGGAISVAGGAAFGKDVYIGGKMTIIDTSPSSSSQTGSLVVYGGIGVNGGILTRNDDIQLEIAPKTSGVSTQIKFYSLNNFSEANNTGSSWVIGQNVGSVGAGNFAINNSYFGNVLTAGYDGTTTLTGNIIVNNSTNATSSTFGGALTVEGGGAFGKDLYVGGVITLAGGITLSGLGGASEFTYLSVTSTDTSINSSTGSFVTFGGASIKTTMDATSITNGGGLTVAGGVSIGKSLFIGGSILQIPTGNIASRPSDPSLGYVRYNTETSQFEGYGPGNAWGSLGGVVDIAQSTKVLASASPSVTDGNLYFYTVSNERMRINSSGNVGIGTTAPNAKLHVDGDTIVANLTTGSIYSTNITTVNIISDFISTSSLNVTTGIVSTNLSTTNITCSNILCTNITTSGLLTLTNIDSTNATSNNLYATNITVSNNLKVTNSLSVGDINTSNDSNTIGPIVTNSGSVGIGFVNPAYLLDVNGDVHVNADLYVDGVISGGAGTASTFAYLTLTATDEAINFSTGSLITLGGVTIQAESDATSLTDAGSLLTAGGAAIGKNLFVGKNVYIKSTEQSTGVGTGGSFTTLGGASISKDLYVGGTVTSSSDERLKTNIKDITENINILDKIDNIRCVKYNFKDDPLETTQIGFIAQDFCKHFPELLKCPDGGFYSLEYQKVTVILMQCIKELKTEIDFLKRINYN